MLCPAHLILHYLTFRMIFGEQYRPLSSSLRSLLHSLSPRPPYVQPSPQHPLTNTLGFPSGLFPSGFPNNVCLNLSTPPYAHIVSSPMTTKLLQSYIELATG
jgi:hypothetical protein